MINPVKYLHWAPPVSATKYFGSSSRIQINAKLVQLLADLDGTLVSRRWSVDQRMFSAANPKLSLEFVRLKAIWKSKISAGLALAGMHKGSNRICGSADQRNQRIAHLIQLTRLRPAALPKLWAVEWLKVRAAGKCRPTRSWRALPGMFGCLLGRAGGQLILVRLIN